MSISALIEGSEVVLKLTTTIDDAVGNSGILALGFPCSITYAALTTLSIYAVIGAAIDSSAVGFSLAVTVSIQISASFANTSKTAIIAVGSSTLHEIAKLAIGFTTRISSTEKETGFILAIIHAAEYFRTCTGGAG